jgi:hypothetical protein
MKKAKHTYLALYWLKRVVVVGSVPLLTATLAFYFFKALPGSFESEAQIEFFFPDDYGDADDERDQFLKNRIRPLLESMKSERSRELLSLSLLEKELSEDSVIFADQAVWDELGLEAHKDSLISLCQTKRANFNLGFSGQTGDSSLYKILDKLRFGSDFLEDEIVIRRIPGTNTIGIQARTYNAKLSNFLVDQFCREFIRYHVIADKERLEEYLEHLEGLLTRRKADLEDRQLALEKMRDQLAHSSGKRELILVLSKIGELELNRKEEKSRVESIKAALRQFRKQNNKNTTVRAVHFSDDRVNENSDANLAKEDQETKLLVELGAAMARIEFLDQEIETLKERLEKMEQEVLAPYHKEVEKARKVYLKARQDVQETKAEYDRVESSLQVKKWGKARMRMPDAHKLLSLLAGFASFFVWLVFLVNIEFITIKPMNK